MSRARTEELKPKVAKRLRKRDRKTLGTIADEIGVKRHSLALPIRELVDAGLAIRHSDSSPPTYTKP